MTCRRFLRGAPTKRRPLKSREPRNSIWRNTTRKSPIIVRLSKGGIATPVDPHKVDIFLLIGIYDNDRRNIGHKTVLEIIEDIQKHYEKHPTLCGGAFQFTDPFTWVLQDEPSYPYFYGGCNLSFNLAAPRTESRFT